MSKRESVGDVLLQIEPLLDKLCKHGLQHQDIVALVMVQLETHNPGARAIYLDGSHPRIEWK